jgi:SAM-dependent methyltransferase
MGPGAALRNSRLAPHLRRARQWLSPLLPGWPDEGRRVVQGPHLSALLARVAATGPRRVLNAGAGEGLYSPLLLALPTAERVVEMDRSYFFRHRAADRRRVFTTASLDALPFAAGAIDLLLCTEVLEHVPEDGRALDEITRVLAPGGWLLLSVPTPPAEPDPAHVREGYEPERLAALLAARGLTVIESRRCMRLFFRFVLRRWRPGRFPRAAILALAWLDRALPLGPPMDVIVLARARGDA